VQPLNQLAERIDRPGGEDNDAAVCLIAGMAAHRQGTRMLGGARPEEHALHAPADMDAARGLRYGPRIHWLNRL